MSVKIKGLSKLRNKLDKVQKDIEKVDPYLYTVGNAIKSEIIRRTTSGFDYRNRKMTYNGKYYSDKYAEFRRENKRATNRRTLSFRGNMIRSIRPKKILNGLMLWFPDTEEREKAKYQQEKFRTIFFKLSKSQRVKYIAKVKKYITRHL